jgi:hypothetical protein
MPLASKTNVFTSASAPLAGISWPFQRKVTPAAFPIFATISRLARTEAWAGAMRVSWLTVWPSAWTEIQEVSWARITTVREVADFAGDGATGLPKVRVVTSFGSAPLAELAVEAAGAGVDDGTEVKEDGAVWGGCEFGVAGVAVRLAGAGLDG